MSKTKTLKFGLAGVVALLSLSACVSPDEVSSLDSRVGALESRLSSAEARASQLEAPGKGSFLGRLRRVLAEGREPTSAIDGLDPPPRWRRCLEGNCRAIRAA